MSNRQRGFALLIVLWTVGFLALLGTRIVAAGRSDAQLADNLKQEATLQAAADGAVAQVVFQMLAAKNPAFRADGIERAIRVGQTAVLVRIENESDRVNLNSAAGPVLRALIMETGGAPALADRVTAAILDWRTSGASARPDGAKASDYLAAGRAYGPPGAPFQSVEELANVLGVTPDLYARLEPHLTVLTDGDPDMSTRDPVVARALADAAGGVDDTATVPEVADTLLRIGAIAIGSAGARYSLLAVASADFRDATPHVNVLLQEHGRALTFRNGSDRS